MNTGTLRRRCNFLQDLRDTLTFDTRGAPELDHRNLGGCAEPQRRAPIARAPTHVEPHRPHAMETVRKGLEEADQEIEWEVLAAVRVTGQLQIESRRLGGERAPRLVCEQHLRVAGRRAG